VLPSSETPSACGKLQIAWQAFFLKVENMITYLPHTNFSNFQPEKHLWAAVLALFIADARFYIESQKAKEPHHKQAFDDLCFCGTMTKRLCAMTDKNPVWLSEKFRKFAQTAMQTQIK
jgi:hypothetical protein